MTDVTNINAVVTSPSSLSGGVTVAPSKAVVAGGPFAAALAATAPETASGASRVVSNPLARVIVTQYYGNDGKVVAQVPSSTVVAYLESGLTADGLPQKSSTV